MILAVQLGIDSHIGPHRRTGGQKQRLFQYDRHRDQRKTSRDRSGITARRTKLTL